MTYLDHDLLAVLDDWHTRAAIVSRARTLWPCLDAMLAEHERAGRIVRHDTALGPMWRRRTVTR